MKYKSILAINIAIQPNDVIIRPIHFVVHQKNRCNYVRMYNNEFRLYLCIINV